MSLAGWRGWSTGEVSPPGEAVGLSQLTGSPRRSSCGWCGEEWLTEEDCTRSYARGVEPSPLRLVPALSRTERYLTTDQAADYLNVAPRFIRRLVEEGRVVVTKTGRFNRFTRADLDAVTTRVIQRPTKPSKDAPPAREVQPPTPATDPIRSAILRASLSGPRDTTG